MAKPGGGEREFRLEENERKEAAQTMYSFYFISTTLLNFLGGFDWKRKPGACIVVSTLDMDDREIIEFSRRKWSLSCIQPERKNRSQTLRKQQLRVRGKKGGGNRPHVAQCVKCERRLIITT
jgi:hypothetical protein